MAPEAGTPRTERDARGVGLRIALAGGGTGGHLVPGLHLLACEPAGFDDVLWLTGGRAIEGRVLAGLTDATPAPARVVTLPVENRGGGAPGWARLSLRMPSAVRAARRALRAHRSQVLLGLGGYVSVPAIVAARSLGVPVALLEINATAGRATRGLERLATRVLSAWPGTHPAGSRASKVRLVGPPLAPCFDEGRAPSSAFAREALGFAPERPLLVVLGGSQGAGGLNAFVRAHGPALLAAGASVLHQVGPGRADEAAAPGAHYRAVEYVEDVATALAGATAVLCRGGASTLAEVAALRVPAWVVPYPHHADRHQEHNARQLGEGVRIVPEDELGPRIAQGLVELLSPRGAERREQMRQALARAVPRDGARRVLEELRAIARGG